MLENEVLIYQSQRGLLRTRRPILSTQGPTLTMHTWTTTQTPWVDTPPSASYVIAEPMDDGAVADHVLTVVSQVVGLPLVRILSRSRFRELVEARRIVYYVLRQTYGWTLKRIATVTGTDHTNVIHHIRMGDELRQINDPWALTLATVRKLL